MKPRYLPIAALLAALAIAGCGGGDDDSSTAAPATTAATTAALTKDELIAQGDAICAEVNAAVGTVSASDADSASQISQEADLYGGMVERLKGLGAPEDTTGYPELIAAADELAQAESDAELASERGDESGLLEAEASVATALSSFQAAAQAYGFEACGEAPSAPTPVTSGEAPTEESSEAVEEEVEAAPEEAAPAPETGGAGGTGGETGGGAAGGTGGGGVSGGGSGGIGPG